MLSAAEMQRWDRRAGEDAGVPERVLMETAGRATARVVAERFPEGRVVGAVGRGHNGGDALVALRTLRAWGREVLAVPVGGELPQALAHGWALPVAELGREPCPFDGAGSVLDGVLGTGASGAPRGAAAEAVRRMNAAGAPVVAVDGPTGVDLTTGATPGDAVRAAVTVTFGAPKRGHLLFPGRTCTGRLVVMEVGFPPLLPEESSAGLVTPGWTRGRIPCRPPDAHKGTAGTLALLAGSGAMAGAAILAAHGALRAGVGKVRVICSPEARTAVNATLPEALFVDRSGAGARSAMEEADAVVAGPGMGREEPVLELLRLLLHETQCPALLDADALNLLAEHPDLIPDEGRDRLLLTPHPGEMSRLLARPTRELVADPFAAAGAALERFGCAVLVKGVPSLVASPGTKILVNATGHSGIATGGMGDTLAGVAGAFLAAGATPRDAAAAAAFVCGRAAELAGRGRGLLPRDVAECLPASLLGLDAPDETTRPEVVLDLPPAR